MTSFIPIFFNWYFLKRRCNIIVEHNRKYKRGALAEFGPDPNASIKGFDDVF